MRTVTIAERPTGAFEVELHLSHSEAERLGWIMGIARATLPRTLARHEFSEGDWQHDALANATSRFMVDMRDMLEAALNNRSSRAGSVDALWQLQRSDAEHAQDENEVPEEAPTPRPSRPINYPDLIVSGAGRAQRPTEPTPATLTVRLGDSGSSRSRPTR